MHLVTVQAEAKITQSKKSFQNMFQYVPLHSKGHCLNVENTLMHDHQNSLYFTETQMQICVTVASTHSYFQQHAY